MSYSELSVEKYLDKIRRKLRKLDYETSRFAHHTLASKTMPLIAAEFCRELAPLFKVRPDGFSLSFDLVDQYFPYDLYTQRKKFKPLRDELKRYGWKMRVETAKQRVLFLPLKRVRPR